MTDPLFDQLTWLDKAENPFGLICLDCRNFTHTMLSTTHDPLVARRFSELRHASGKQYQGLQPPNAQTISCTLEYSLTEPPKDGPLFRATTMEDKWDIFLYEGVLYFSRSWTGHLVLTARVKIDNSALIVYLIEANAEVVSQDAFFIIRQVDFLIKSHLFHSLAPHPLPPDLPKDTRTIALYSFSQYGRRASFATYEDTIIGPIQDKT